MIAKNYIHFGLTRIVIQETPNPTVFNRHSKFYEMMAVFIA